MHVEWTTRLAKTTGIEEMLVNVVQCCCTGFRWLSESFYSEAELL